MMWSLRDFAPASRHAWSRSHFADDASTPPVWLCCVATALRSALWGDHAVSVLLPTRGADPSLKDKDGDNAMAYAGFAAKKDELMAVLRARMGGE